MDHVHQSYERRLVVEFVRIPYHPGRLSFDARHLPMRYHRFHIRVIGRALAGGPLCMHRQIDRRGWAVEIERICSPHRRMFVCHASQKSCVRRQGLPCGNCLQICCVLSQNVVSWDWQQSDWCRFVPIWNYCCSWTTCLENLVWMIVYLD